MIDWDEVLEDVNWVRGIILLVVGVVVIGAIIFVALDYSKSKQIKTQLKQDIEDIKAFEASWTVPGQDRIKDWENEAAALKNELEAKDIDLPDEFDQQAAEDSIRELASNNRVTIENIRWSDEGADEFCSVWPMEIVMTGNARSSAAFLSGLYKLPHPLANKSPNTRLSGTKKLTIEFYSFNQSSWNAANDCDLSVTMPTIESRDVGSSIIFGGELKSLADQVDRMTADLVQVKEDMVEACKARTEVERLKTKLEILENKPQNK